MNKNLYLILGALPLLTCGCRSDQQESSVVSERYIHKYGYTLSKEDWDSNRYPGQVITTLRNGVTVSATYENGVLHGPCTHTFPDSQIIQFYFLYNQGNLVKEIAYHISGIPLSEHTQLSPSCYTTTFWYSDGTPMRVEEYAGEELLEGDYFTKNNETEARVQKGRGTRIRRNQEGDLLSVDQISQGYMVKRETFFPDKAPQSVATYSEGKLHGEKKVFAQTGEPISIEEYADDLLDGQTAYFKNGSKYLELSYMEGMRHGIEIHYLDGEIISQEISWAYDKKHGPSTFYIDDIAHTEWYYDGKPVSYAKYQELTHLDEMLTRTPPDQRADFR